jgi:uncharacterized membrane protein YdjX (TVP38/TMEM64 family)
MVESQMSAPLKPPLTNGYKPSMAEPATDSTIPEPAEQQRSWSFVRLEYALLAAVGLLMTAFAFLFFFFDVSLVQLNTYGYAGLFLITLISAASIVLPMPGAAAIAGAGAVLDPVLGIPVPIMVGLVAGLAEALGEFTGYAAGYGGSALFRDRPIYPRVKGWMERRGMLTMFALSCIPNPLVDVAGVAAGAVQMRVWRFFVGVFGGKVVKNIYLSSGGLVAAEIIQRLFG